MEKKFYHPDENDSFQYNISVQVPGGRLGDMFGTKKVFGLAM